MDCENGLKKDKPEEVYSTENQRLNFMPIRIEIAV
jgi:hypothetical protein